MHTAVLLCSSWWYAGATSGTILSYASAPAIIARYNWPGLFVIYGSLGLLWCMFWIPLVKEEPKSRMYPHGEGIKGVGDVPWESFARSSAVWAIFVAQCTQGRAAAHAKQVSACVHARSGLVMCM